MRVQFGLLLLLQSSECAGFIDRDQIAAHYAARARVHQVLHGTAVVHSADDLLNARASEREKEKAKDMTDH